MTVGLKAIISKTGTITYYVQYDVLGMHPEMTIAEARFLARTFRELGGRLYDVDPLANVEKERIAEVLKQGNKWRPPAKKKPDYT